jgi:hypothetical protein
VLVRVAGRFIENSRAGAITRCSTSSSRIWVFLARPAPAYACAFALVTAYR